MTDNEIALELAEAIMRLQMKKIAFESVINRCRIDGIQLPWTEMVDETFDELVSGDAFFSRLDQLRQRFELDAPDGLIRILRDELLPAPKNC